MTQNEKIVEYMQRNGSITQREAIKLGSYRLSARIFELKKQGYGIKTERVNVQNSDGSIANIGRYYLIGGNDVDRRGHSNS